MRYLPAYVSDFEAALNAQMARGYRTKADKKVFATIINTVPLIVPVSVNAMLSVYEVADAMELRGIRGLQVEDLVSDSKVPQIGLRHHGCRLCRLDRLRPS